MSRNIQKFRHPEKLIRFKDDCFTKYGIIIEYICIDRDLFTQFVLYFQGRKDLYTVNTLRRLNDMAPITEGNKIVTNTIMSKHVPKDISGIVDAADFAIRDLNGDFSWDDKADYNSDNINDYEQCAKLAEEHGFISGRHNGDWGHIELPDENPLPKNIIKGKITIELE